MMRKCWKTSRKETSSLSKGMPIHVLMSMRMMYPRRRRTKSPCFSVILPAGIPCRVCFSQKTSVTLLNDRTGEVYVRPRYEPGLLGDRVAAGFIDIRRAEANIGHVDDRRGRELVAGVEIEGGPGGALESAAGASPAVQTQDAGSQLDGTVVVESQAQLGTASARRLDKGGAGI